MLSRLRQLFRAAEPANTATLPAGQRAYAVGDIHGRADLFAALIAAIDADDAARGPAATTVILLGDLIDRGPDSAGVIRLAREWQARRPVRILTGNHEEMFLDALEKPEVMRHFLRFGGRETLLSYPIDPLEYTRAELDEVITLARRAIPPEDIAFVRSFEDQVLLGDYLFVHAGIRPGVPLDDQRQSDLRWIREPFLDHPESFGPVVIHGHTITEQAEIRTNRIGIDTGAYRSGRLTALGLESTERWLIGAIEQEGAVRVVEGV
ncbi:MAG: metallophosphoesterase family protein [Sphingomonadaceae bacterium]|nr:metallophosphoesterase family protein [Sphingomonadaceae bacterium]